MTPEAQLGRAGWLVPSRSLPASTSHVLGWQIHTISNFLHDCLDLNSGPRAWMASTLPTEMPPCHHNNFWKFYFLHWMGGLHPRIHTGRGQRSVFHEPFSLLWALGIEHAIGLARLPADLHSEPFRQLSHLAPSWLTSNSACPATEVPLIDPPL